MEQKLRSKPEFRLSDEGQGVEGEGLPIAFMEP